MKRNIGILLILCLAPLHFALAASNPSDREGSKDPALFSRMPGFHIYNYEELDFNRQEFWVGGNKKQPVEGRYYFVDYYANEGIRIPSGLQIIRNYVNAAKAVGGKALYEWEDGGTQYVTLKIVKDNSEVWAEIAGANNGMYKVYVIEKQLMKQDVVATAESLAGNINETGRAAVYGIYFDTGKAEIKPESETALAAIAKLLNTDSQIKLYVVGHTDNVGALDYNINLSKDRAAAVVKALVVKYGIASSRLTPFGNGPTAPVASNKSDEGRAKNRRVELVAQ